MIKDLKHIAINPYDVLGVSQAASKAEIVTAKVAAMKRKQYSLNVIADAEKKLLKTPERIIADYLRPVLPVVKRFKREDLSLLETPVPTLVFLPDFDKLDAAISKSLREEQLEKETVSLSRLDLYQSGIESCQQGNHTKGIELLNEFLRSCLEQNDTEYLKAHIWLVETYKISGNLEEAIALCKKLATGEHPQLKNWAEKALTALIAPKQAQKSGEQEKIQPKVSFETALAAFNQKRYVEAVKLLEQFSQSCANKKSKEYIQAQINLVKAYHEVGQLKKAITLCQQLSTTNHPQVQKWAIQTLNSLCAKTPAPVDGGEPNKQSLPTQAL